VSFLLGAGWGIALVGAVSFFFSFLYSGFFFALLSAVLGALPGLVLVVFLEYFVLKSDMLDEMRRQTRLLEKISERHPD
jgi:uncharacterized RDD family membrane protein YckC